MATSMQDILGWIERGKEAKATHLIVVCDTFDYDDYPVFVKPGQDAREVFEHYHGKNMQRVMEVYNLSMDIGEQLNEHRAMHF